MPTLEDEVAYVSGVNSDGTVAATSFATWNPNTTPATYNQRPSSTAKWGGDTAGSAGGTVNYAFDPAWSPIEQDEFRSVLAFYAAVADISFNEVTSLAGPGITITRGSDHGSSTASVTNTASGAGTVGGTKLWTQKAGHRFHRS